MKLVYCRYISHRLRVNCINQLGLNLHIYIYDNHRLIINQLEFPINLWVESPCYESVATRQESASRPNRFRETTCSCSKDKLLSCARCAICSSPELFFFYGILHIFSGISNSFINTDVKTHYPMDFTLW